MICVRCGRCCVSMPVAILADPDNNVWAFKGGDEVCPHLSFDESKRASCAVHEHPRYEGSPCHIYGNSDFDPDFLHKRGKPCRIGQMLLDAGTDVCKGAERPQLEDLEVMEGIP